MWYMKNILLLVSVLFIGAGCISASTAIEKNVGKYSFNGPVQSGIDKNSSGVSFTTDYAQYTSASHSVDVVVYTGASSQDINQYVQFMLEDEAGDGQGFGAVSVLGGNVNYRRDASNNNSCMYVWPSGNVMVMLNAANCDVKDDLVSAYLTKYSPR